MKIVKKLKMRESMHPAAKMAEVIIIVDLLPLWTGVSTIGAESLHKLGGSHSLLWWKCRNLQLHTCYYPLTANVTLLHMSQMLYMSILR